MVDLMVCPFHSYEDVPGELVSGPGEWPQYSYMCPLSVGHPAERRFSWVLPRVHAIGDVWPERRAGA